VLRFRDYDIYTHSTKVAWDLNISDWKIDEGVTRQITEAISPQVTVKPITFNNAWVYRGRFAAVEPLERRLKDYVRNMPATNGVDAYIIVQKDFGATVRQDQYSPLMGLQVNKTAELLALTSKTPVYVDYTIFVIKAGTGEVLGREYAEVSDKFWEESEPVFYRRKHLGEFRKRIDKQSEARAEIHNHPHCHVHAVRRARPVGLTSKGAPILDKRP